MPAKLQQVLEETCQSIRTAAQVLKAGPGKDTAEEPTASNTEPKLALDKAAEALKGEVAKCAVLWQAGEPNAAEAESLLTALQQRVAALCAVLSRAQGGPTLITELYRLAIGIANACCAFLTGASSPQVARLAAVVFERCDDAKKAPLDNSTVIGRSILQIITQIRDVLRETGELEESALAMAGNTGDASGDGYQEDVRRGTAESSDVSSCDRAGISVAGAAAGAASMNAGTAGENGKAEEVVSDGAQCSGHGEHEGREAAGVEEAASSQSGSVADVDFEAQRATQEEVAIIVCTRDLLDALVRLLKGVMRVMIQQPADLKGTCEAWESVLFHCKNLLAPVIDLGAGLYSPQDQEELASAADAVATGAEVLVGELPIPDNVAMQFQAEADRLAAAHARLADCIEKL